MSEKLTGIHDRILELIKHAAAEQNHKELLAEFEDKGNLRLARLMFSSLRSEGAEWRGLSLTSFGLNIMKSYFKSFKIPIQNNAKISSRGILFMDSVAKMPYHTSKNEIVVFERNLGVMLRLAEGDIETLREMETFETQRKELT